MSERTSAQIDARHTVALTVSGLPELPEVEPMPQLLTDELAAGPARARVRHRVAAMPVVVADSCTETRPLDVYHPIDVSYSNATTDPQGARFTDFAFLSRSWTPDVVPDATFTQVLFDDRAQVYPRCRPDEVPEDGWRRRPNPGSGGTQFVPVMRAVAAEAARYPDHAALVIFYSDGLGNDVAEANAILVAAGLRAVMIPYGPDFPWVAARWEHTAFRIAAHVDDRPRAIAQTAALAIVETLGFERGDLTRAPVRRSA